jgi:energy-coupling factor transport system substrate-specific component
VSAVLDGGGGASGGRHTAIRVRPRSAAALALVSVAGLAAFGWPLFIAPESTLLGGGTGSASSAGSLQAPFLFVALLPLLLAVVLAELSEGGMDAKAVALLGVLAAVGAALRPLGGGAAGIEPMFFLLVLSGRVLGRGFGFVLGAVTLFASALLTGGVGPWLPFQMIAAAWVGFLAGCLPPARGRAELALLAGYGAVAGFLYGALMNMSFWPFVAGPESGIAFAAGAPLLENLQRFLAFTLATSFGFDIPRAIINVVLILVTGRAVLLALRRAARRAAFQAPVEFQAPVKFQAPVEFRGDTP